MVKRTKIGYITISIKYGEKEIKRTAKMGEILDQGIKYSREVVHNLLPGICKFVVPIPMMKLNIASILVS